jgi:hypothetical protein
MHAENQQEEDYSKEIGHGKILEPVTINLQVLYLYLTQ